MANAKINDAPATAIGKGTGSAPQRKPRSLSGDALAWYEVNNNRHRGVAPTGFSPQELSENAEFWQHVRDKLQPYDDVRLVAADDAWIADFVVCRSRAIKLIPGSIVIQPKQTSIGQELTIPEPWELCETGPSDPYPGLFFRHKATGQRIESSGGAPWPSHDRVKAITDFNNLAMFRKDNASTYLP